MIFPKSEYKILLSIYENPGIRLSELMKKARISAGTAKKRLEHLLNSGIITESNISGGKRILLRIFYPNFFSEEGMNVFSLVESEKKQEFFKKNRNLIGPFKQLLKNVEHGIKVILVFGSFASYSQLRDSDLDILLLTKGKLDKDKLEKEIERSFVTFTHEISPRIDNLNNFKKNINKGIYQTLIKNHIIIKGSLDYLRSIR